MVVCPFDLIALYVSQASLYNVSVVAVFADILVCFKPDILVDQFLTTGDIGRVAATNNQLHILWQPLLRALRREKLAVASIRFDRLLQSINDNRRR